MRFILAAAGALALTLPPSAKAVLVYQAPQPSAGGDVPIIAAKNDGTDARVIAQGIGPRVSPNGHKVVYVKGNESLWVVGNRGRRRHLLTKHVYDTGPFIQFAWSHDERHLIAPSTSGGAWLVDVRDRTKTRIRLNGEFFGASFNPDDSLFAISRASAVRSTLAAIDLPTLERHPLGEGTGPVWGQPGVAYAGPDGLMLRKDLDERPETLLRQSAFPVDWSADGRRLLAQNAYLARQPILIDLHPRRIKRLKHRIIPAQLSRDGSEVLGRTGKGNQAAGNIVVREPNGTIRTLATNATRPSWTK
jgi:hypothetical protein